jgi:hypothetical protein
VKLGIMQPYFFPYLGYYDLINRTDRWIVFDVVAYAPKTWMNRNRILHPTEGWQYISVPVHHTAGQTVAEIELVDAAAARRHVLGQIEHYRQGRAPFFRQTRELVDGAFGATQTNKLRDLNVASLKIVCDYLGITMEYSILSEMRLQLPHIEHPGQWALEISAALGADEYVNPPSGRPIFRQEEFDERGIRLTFTELVDYRYDCKGYQFVEHLSIVDVLMWNEPAAVKAYLDARRTQSALPASGSAT